MHENNNLLENNRSNIIKKLSKLEIEVIINNKLFEFLVIPGELYQTVRDNLLFKIENLKEELELITSS